jgi:hypothetical protein
VNYINTIADYTPLLISINWGTRLPGTLKRLWINTLDQELFTSLLEANYSMLSPLLESLTSIDLD